MKLHNRADSAGTWTPPLPVMTPRVRVLPTKKHSVCSFYFILVIWGFSLPNPCPLLWCSLTWTCSILLSKSHMVRNNLKSFLLEPSKTKEFGKIKRESGILTWGMKTNWLILNLNPRDRGNAVSVELGEVPRGKRSNGLAFLRTQKYNMTQFFFFPFLKENYNEILT